MLASLSIRNLALVEDINWEPGEGLTALTGETGAGKSMVIGALELVLGKRARSGLIRNEAKTAEVSALFQPEERLKPRLGRILEEAGIDLDEDGLLIRRQLRSSGTRQWVNDQATTVGLLERLGAELVDLHGPHDHQSLFSRERQRDLLDAFGKLENQVDQVKLAYRNWRNTWTELENARQQEQASDAELELLCHREQEISDAALVVGEDVELEQAHTRARNSARLAENTQKAYELLNKPSEGVLAQLTEVQRNLRELERLDETAASWISEFASTFVELDELAANLESYYQNLESNPEETARLEARYDIVTSLKQKYGPSLEEVIALGEAAKQRLSQLENREETLSQLEDQELQARQKRDAAMAELTQKRQEVAPRLAKEISAHLADLGFAQNQFEIVLEALAQPNSSGSDSVDFLFAPNPGESAKPLRKVASSGEMSRVMLALKCALALVDPVSLLVFDEIDANVGGTVAVSVGAKLAELGENRQVVAITHFPQVAALAKDQYLVAKEVENDTTKTTLTQLEGETRLIELARMLGGDSQSARSHAAKLLGNRKESTKPDLLL